MSLNDVQFYSLTDIALYLPAICIRDNRSSRPQDVVYQTVNVHLQSLYIFFKILHLSAFPLSARLCQSCNLAPRIRFTASTELTLHRNAQKSACLFVRCRWTRIMRRTRRVRHQLYVNASESSRWHVDHPRVTYQQATTTAYSIRPCHIGVIIINAIEYCVISAFV